MWVLILTMTAGHPYGGSTITSIPGFSNRATCYRAADEWLRTTNQKTVYLSRICVEIK